MKTSIIITLIVAGTVLVLTPSISDHIHQSNLVELMTQNPDRLAHLGATMDDFYRFICWGLGIVMVAIGVFGAFQKGGSKS